jgi:hypothetical protein
VGRSATTGTGQDRELQSGWRQTGGIKVVKRMGQEAMAKRVHLDVCLNKRTLHLAFHDNHTCCGGAGQLAYDIHPLLLAKRSSLRLKVRRCNFGQEVRAEWRA